MPHLQATQNSILAYEKRHPGTSTYHRSAIVEINGTINPALLNKAVIKAMHRHDMLRMRINNDQAARFDLIANENLPISDHWPLQHIDATSFPDSPPEQLYSTLSRISKKDFIDTPFDMHSAPLWRAGLVKLAEDKHQFALLFHHLIIDEPSIGIITQDISSFYNSLINSTEVDLPALPSLNNVDFTLPKHEESKRLAYWNKTLKGLKATRLQADKTANKSFHFNGKRIPFKLDKELIRDLKSAMPNITMNSILLTAFYSLLHRYTGESDICIGVTSANRRQDHAVKRDTMERLVNAYFNSIPIRINAANTDLNFSDMLASVHKSVLDGLRNQLPHDQLFQEGLDKETRANLGIASLFNFLLVTNTVKPTLNLHGTTASRIIELDLGHSKFESFGINCDELEDGSYECFIEYNTDQFNEETIARLIRHLHNILAYTAHYPTTTISDIPMLTPEEIKEVAELNDTTAQPVYTGSMASLIHAVARSAPVNQNAITFHHQDDTKESLTYAALETTTNQIANTISDQSNQPIGICLTRSMNLIVTILAALKSGRPFVVLDPDDMNGTTRKLDLVKPSLIIADRTTDSIFSHSVTRRINLDNADDKKTIASASPVFHPPAVRESDTAYMIHTSGTTGKPKMVRCSHGAMLNLVDSLIADQNHKPHTKILNTAPATFDSFLYDILVALATTGEIHMAFERGRLSPNTIERICKQEKIDFAALTAELLPQIDETIPLQRVISMGNAANEAAIKRWLDAGKLIENDFGLTEAGIHSSTHHCTPDDDPGLIGAPLRNVQMIILDKQGNLCPIGVPGELYVSGAGLALDYLDNPELTRQKFRFAKFDTSSQKYIFTDHPDAATIRLYATGDSCCYAKNTHGNLEVKHIGRLDKIIKIHGMRIEINEIRKIIARHPLVNAVVLLPNDNHTGLNAFILPKSQLTPLEQIRSELRRYLTTTNIPPGAYPRTIMTLTKLPLNDNGKLDVSALPTPIELKPRLATSTRQSELLTKLIAITHNILKLDATEDIDLNKTFRELGGNSLALAALETTLNNSNDIRFMLNLPASISFNFKALPSPDMTLPELESSLSDFARPYKLDASRRLTLLPPLSQYDESSHTKMQNTNPKDTFLNNDR